MTGPLQSWARSASRDDLVSELLRMDAELAGPGADRAGVKTEERLERIERHLGLWECPHEWVEIPLSECEGMIWTQILGDPAPPPDHGVRCTRCKQQRWAPERGGQEWAS